MALRPRTTAAVVVAGVVAVAAAALLATRPTLEDARGTVDDRWEALRPVLVERYDHVRTLADAVRAARPDHDLLDDTDRALARWDRARGGEPDAERQPEVAVRVETAGTRLAIAVAASPRLAEAEGVPGAVAAFATHDPSTALAAYNDAVTKYDSARRRFPGGFFAGFLGYDPVRTVEVSGALSDLATRLPAPPPPPSPEASPAPEG